METWAEDSVSTRPDGQPDGGSLRRHVCSECKVVQCSFSADIVYLHIMEPLQLPSQRRPSELTLESIDQVKEGETFKNLPHSLIFLHRPRTDT